MSKVERYRRYAKNAKRRSDEHYQASHAVVDRIPFGQPILVGHHSESGHRRALRSYDSRMRQSIAEDGRAAYWSQRADRVEYRESQLEHAKALSNVVEGEFENGDEVVARFTNSNRIYEFRGIVVGRTKNDWKVKSLESPYADQGEQPGRVFYIPTCSSRKHSVNNRIRRPDPLPAN